MMASGNWFFKENYVLLVTILPWELCDPDCSSHYSDVTLAWWVSQIAGNWNACSTGCQDPQQSKYQSAPILALCGGNPLVIGRSPLQWASNAKNISMSWPYRVDRMTRTMTMKQPWGIEVNQSLPYRIVNNKGYFGDILESYRANLW